jgi:hypothetical protein
MIAMFVLHRRSLPTRELDPKGRLVRPSDKIHLRLLQRLLNLLSHRHLTQLFALTFVNGSFL